MSFAVRSGSREQEKTSDRAGCGEEDLQMTVPLPLPVTKTPSVAQTAGGAPGRGGATEGSTREGRGQ